MISRHDAIVGDTVFFPGNAVRFEVEQHRLKPVAGGGKFGFRRVSGFELVPQCPKFGGLISWQ